MNVEIGAEAAPFPEKEYINGIFVAVQYLYFSFPCLKVTCNTRFDNFFWIMNGSVKVRENAAIFIS